MYGTRHHFLTHTERKLGTQITEFVLQDVTPPWTSLTMTDTNASWGARHHSVPTETVFRHLSGVWGLTTHVPNFPLTLVWGRNRVIGITGGGFWLSPRDTTKQLWAFIVGAFSSFFPPKPWCYSWKSSIVTPITRQVALTSSPLPLPIHVHYPLHWVGTKSAKKE